MKSFFLNGLNNIAPMELKKYVIQTFYNDIAPMEHKFDLQNKIDRLVYQLYDLTEEEIKIIENA